MIYRLVHGTSVTHMTDRFNVRASTISKYVDIVCDALCDKDKLFSKYIRISFGDRLPKIIDCFHDLTGLLNICAAIDGIHIPLVSLPNKRMTVTTNDFFNRKKIRNIVM